MSRDRIFAVRPFWWDDLNGRPAWDVWLYRVCVSIGLGCFLFVAGMFFVLLLIGLVEAVA